MSYNLKFLLVEEMRRAVHILENKSVIKKVKRDATGYPEVDRETTELCELLKAIRRHSILLEKSID